jgi:TatA/E family protein of Tat protein translocase
MMNRMSFSETIFLFLLALVIFGPKKLPEIARQVGKALNEFRRASNEFKAQIEQEIAHLEVEKQQTILPPSPPPEGTASRSLKAASGDIYSSSSDVVSATSTSTNSGVGNPPAVSSEPNTSERPATLAASNEAPASPTNGTEPATEAAPNSETVTSSPSQDSHA